MRRVILISGKQGSGKTTLSTEVYKQLQGRARVLKFADPLYELHEHILNKMESWTGQPRKQKDGNLLQVLGTEWGRNSIDQNVWVNIAKRRAERVLEDHPMNVVIFDDCRFPNELLDGALTIRLECSEEIRKSRMQHGWRDNTNHQSETGLDLAHADGIFDLVFDTGELSTEHIASAIVEALRKGI